MTVQLLRSEPAGRGMFRVTLFEGNTRVTALVDSSTMNGPHRDAVFTVLVENERQRLAKAAVRVAPEVTA